MLIETIRTLYAYNAWANARVLAAADGMSTDGMSTDELATMVDGGFGSIQETLVHTMSTQWLYLSRWQGVSPTAQLEPSDFPDVAAIRLRWQEIDRETDDFLVRLTEVDLARDVTYLNFRGEAWTYPLWQQMLHQVNHATQHRSEVAAMLTQRGRSPGWLDFLVYLDERQRG